MTRSSLTAIIKIYPKQKSLRDYFVPPQFSVCMQMSPANEGCVCVLYETLFVGTLNTIKPNSIHVHEIRVEEAESR